MNSKTIETEHGTFTENRESYINKSAEEVYQEFLNPIPQVPQQDLQKAKLEIATLNLLTDLGVI